MPRIMYFSVVRERVGKSEEEIDFQGKVSELRELLSKRYPEVRDLIYRVRFAVNEEYVEDSATVSSEDRVALIPPVSGG